MELLDHRTYYRALQSHDARFDGHVFVGCTSTGIYCRPICPTRPPKFENCRFFASAAAAQEAGFRPCLRCRPEIAPDLAFWRGTANTVSRALALIADGALEASTPTSRPWLGDLASAVGSCGDCSSAISALRRSPSHRRAACCSPSSCCTTRVCR